MVNDYFIGEDNQIYIYVDNAKYTHERKNENVYIDFDEEYKNNDKYVLENMCDCLLYCTGKIVKDTKDFFNTYMCIFYSGDDLNTICSRRIKNIAKI